MLGGRTTDSWEPFHRIELGPMGTITRDGKRVRITANFITDVVQVGCTKVSFSALRHLLKLVEATTNDEKVLQEGEL